MKSETSNVSLLHVDEDKKIWLSENNQMPVMCAGDYYSLEPKLFREDSVVKLIASTDNIPLILSLYNKKLKGDIQSLQICSPIIAHNKKTEIAMMDTCHWKGWPASLGGWHEFSEDDYPSYYLANYFATNSKLATLGVFDEVLKAHPAWKGLSFISHLNMDKCARLLATILDPRWFIDIKEPDKNSRIENFLGLKPSILSKTKSLSNSQSRQIRNCRLVLESWKMGRPTSDSEYNQPDNFLWRIHALEGCNEKADIRVSQVFITFLKAVWLDAIYCKSKTSLYMDRLFVPMYFFNKQDEIDAFKQHMLR